MPEQEARPNLSQADRERPLPPFPHEFLDEMRLIAAQRRAERLARKSEQGKAS